MLWIALPIAGLALAIRLYRVTWGLSDGYFFPDEVLIFTPQMLSVAVLDWNASCPARLLYPTLYTNLGGLTLAIAHAAGLVGPFTQSILGERHASVIRCLACRCAAGRDVLFGR
jgi:hypothetical protein